ncbi:PAS domain-containing sensor histidine kinase [Acetobacteraceae bacterium ESL0709]|nr:PAS domain-containing sensor histidine kinase [Acetobacteraceae bacterium ESL0697]MDF7677317.1 PAS domain-containing sensor histidine kinase [Acetobacteraceae bacterium ESL0709]
MTFVVLAGGVQATHLPQLQAILFLLDFVALLLIGAASIRQFGHMLAERRMGLAGARLHTRLVTLFGVVAVAPTLMLGALAALFFHFGVEIWFSTRVNTALTEAQSVAAGYLREHNDNTRTEAFALANTLLTVQNDEFLTRGSDIFHDPSRLQSLLEDEVTERGLTDAVIFDPLTDKIVATGGLLVRRDKHSFITTLPPKSMIEMARAGDVAVLDEPDSRVIRAVISLGSNSGLMLVLTKQVDPDILRHVRRTTSLVHDYQRMIQNRGKTQVVFVGIFALMGLLVLAVGMLTGLALANRIAHPLSLLILAAKRVSQGDLAVRVPVKNKPDERDDEVMALSRAFNSMTDQLESQRAELLLAYDQINERRRFTETVLGGVSAGVIGLDKRQIIKLPNRMASTILQRNLQEQTGSLLVESVPEFAKLLDSACKVPDHEHMAEIQIDGAQSSAPGGPGEGGGAAAGRTLLVRIVAEWRGDEVEGYVVTFDDITQLQIAQRKGAWADVARRVAHEIKNPLTPIQLAAERLKKRFQKEIISDPNTYNQLIETIIRQVGDIGRMVDEFSSFARMPQPVMEPYDLARLCLEALILQRHAHPEIIYTTCGLDKGPVMALCDRRLLGQALTNLLQNAADAITMTGRKAEGTPVIGHITVRLVVNSYEAVISVEDNGVGLPERERHRLVEPYVTHKPKGTGLGLAIVKKIMDAHKGRLSLEDRASCVEEADQNSTEETIKGTRVSLSVLLSDTVESLAASSDYEGKA